MSLERRGGVRDALAAVLLLAFFAALYRATFQARMTGDGPVLADSLLFVDGAVHWHVLYLPAARVVARVLAWGPINGVDPLEPLRLLSALGGAAGVGGAFLVARRLGVERRAALAAAALVGLSPGTWFYATSIEVHAPHAGVVAVAVLVTLRAPWGRPVLALAVAAALLALTILSHLSAPLLGLGWVLLCARGREWRHPPFRPRTLWLAVAPTLLAAELATLGALWLAWRGAFGTVAQTPLAFLASYARLGDTAAFAWNDVVLPLALVLPAAALGVARGLRRPEGRATVTLVAAALLPPLAFLLAWGVPERGGYLVGYAAFLVPLAGVGLAAERRPSRAFVAGLVAAQALCGAWTVRAHDRGLDPSVRAELVRAALPDGGVLGSVGYLAPRMRLEGVIEVDLTVPIRVAFDARRPAGDAARELADRIDAVLVNGPVLLDLSHRDVPWPSVEPEFIAYALAFEDTLVARYDSGRVERDRWAFVALRPRR